MLSFVQNALSWALAQSWAIPAAGLAVAGLAYVLGRRCFVPRPRQPEEAVSANFLEGVLTERRAAPRRKKGASVLVELSDGRGGPPLQAWVQDRSVGGLGLLAEQPVQVGAALQVRPSNAPEATVWTPVTVRNCRRCGVGQYELGCQFEHTPPWSVLLLFG
jgi:hypothetical protein